MTKEDKKRDPMPSPDATPEEIGEFWDTHSLADYWDETEEVEFRVNLKSEQDQTQSENSEVLVGDYIQTLRQKHKIKKSEYLSNGPIPVIDQGQNFIAGYISDQKRAYDGQLPVIVFGDHTCTLKYVDFPFAVGAEGTQLIRPTKDFDIRYLYYALRNLPLEHFGYQRHFKYLKTSKIFCPSRQSQRKIAAVLSAYDDLIENNTRRIKILEDMAQTLYREWFVHFRFPGHENVRMVESPLGPIPQGWEIGEFGDIVENVKEKVKPGKHLGHLSYVPIDCIPRRSISLVEQKSSSEAKSSLIAFRRNDILFGAMRSYFHKVILAPFDGITRQTCFVLRSKNSSNYPFDLFTAFQESTVQYSSNRSTGSTIPYATWDHALAMMPIFRPPNALIQQFCDASIPMLDSIQVMLKQNATLRRARDLLLPKLISGEIDVSELDVDTNGMQPTKGGTHIPYPLTERLHADKKILGGKPVIKGTRLAVAFILDLLKQGWSEEEVVENYPSVAHEDIDACRAYQEKVTRASVS